MQAIKFPIPSTSTYFFCAMKPNKYLLIICLAFSCLLFQCDSEEFYDHNNTGEGGSFARFTIVGNYLYAVNNQDLKVYNISQANSPVLENTVPIGFGIETLFPLHNHLFIGGNTGMYIYDISNPTAPSNGITFEHARACDPVVANDSLAFITLRNDFSTFDCNSGIEVSSGLYIVDISNINSPELINFIPIASPQGLGYDDSLLFVCKSTAGITVYDYSDPLNLVSLSEINGFDAYDVIPLSGTLLVVGTDEFRQYNYSNPQNLQLISTLKYAL